MSELPPGASPAASRVARALRGPLVRFLRIEAAAGIVLLAATLAALAWANSPWASSYASLWNTPLHLGARGATIDVSLRFVVNDVLMTVFFFVVGLEIKRELRVGELSDVRRAALPLFAAVGGMVVPAAIFLAVNRGDLARGWGIPMATDIAFAAGVLALLGRRVRPSMRVFLLALAIIDDIGAIVMIAAYYSSAFHVEGALIALAGVAGIVALKKLGVRHPIVYVVPAAVLWGGIYRAGIHPAIAGVIVGLLTPAVAWYSSDRFLETVRSSLEPVVNGSLNATGARELVRVVHHAHRESSSPVTRLESALHPWVAYGIMPLFAFANAGIGLATIHVSSAPTLVLGIALGLIVGKPVGIVAASALAVRLRVAQLPRGLSWRGVAVVGVIAGIGFTMALFIADLAFAAHPELHAVAKLAVLVTSAVAALLGVVAAVVSARSSRRAAP